MPERTSGERHTGKLRIDRRRLLQASGALALGGLLAACGGGAAATSTPAAQASAGATTGGAQTGSSVPATKAPASAGTPTKGGSLRVGIVANPISLDPSPSNGELFVLRPIYDSLVTFDAQLNPQPGLAESWDTPDDTTMILHLRKGVKFHDGTDFDAAAVKANIEHTKDPATGTLFTTDFAPIQSVQVVDSQTVKLQLKSVTAPLLASFAMQPGQMISPAVLAKYGKDAGRHPSGTGPFMLQEWVENDHITLKRNPTYWNPDTIYLDEVVFQVVPDPSVRLTNLKAGQLDYVTTLAFKDIAPMRNNASYQLLRTWAGAERLILNNSKPPFNQKPLRQALQFAIDRAGLDTNIFFGSGAIGYGPVHPPGSWAFDPNWKPFDRDLNQARAKLKEGGMPDGFSFTILVSDPIYQQIAQIYQANFAEIGVKVAIQMEDSAKRVADQVSLNYEASLSTWQTTPDPSPALYTPYYSTGSGNYLKYSNPQVDGLLDKAVSTYDRAQRRTYYRQVDQILADDAPCPIPYHRARVDAATTKVKGIQDRADPQFEVRGVWLSK